MLSSDLFILCLASLGAGFVDSIVGGGGLVQFPALMMVLPQYPIVTLLATNKLISLTGTIFSAYRFSHHIRFSGSIIVPAMSGAFIFSFLGAYTVTIVSNDFLRPLFIFLMLIVFVITIRNKMFGLVDHDPDVIIPFWKPLLIGSIIGFYEGFFGPGTGSFLIIAFVGVLGMTFVQGSAYAKIVNLTSSLAALIFFVFKGSFLFQYALPMMILNVLGSYLGVKLALLKGNIFVRGLLRVIIFMTILKLAFDVLKDL